MSTTQASEACMPCRTLKRKCTKELPTCSLCRQLNKNCQYIEILQVRPVRSDDVTIIVQRLERLEQRVDSILLPSSIQVTSDSRATFRIAPEIPNERHVLFPVTYFLDPEMHRQTTPSGQLNLRAAVPAEILFILKSRFAMDSLCDTYISSIHGWLPIISRKRLFERVNSFNEATDAGQALLFVCMKLASETPPGLEQEAISSLYCMAKTYFAKVEASGSISLLLIQSAILISIYEIGHGIYPAAYLRVSNVARLGMIMCLHDRKKAPQLVKDSDNWTECEEERRSWWAIVMLERYLNMGISSMPLISPQPIQGTLLPCLETSWNLGQIGSNAPFYTSYLLETTEIGSFASTCQAAHILGVVIRHRDAQGDDVADSCFRLSEARQLHEKLVSLSTYLTGLSTLFMDDSDTASGLAICYSARLILYTIYACNEHYSATDARIPEETEMQTASINGLAEVSHGIYQIAQRVSDALATGDNNVLSKCLLISHSLYQAASELAWFIREEKVMENVASLRVIIDILKSIEKRWGVAREYLRNLREDGSLAAAGG